MGPQDGSIWGRLAFLMAASTLHDPSNVGSWVFEAGLWGGGDRGDRGCPTRDEKSGVWLGAGLSRDEGLVRPPTFPRQSPHPQHLRVWLYLDWSLQRVGSAKRRLFGGPWSDVTGVP